MQDTVQSEIWTYGDAQKSNQPAAISTVVFQKVVQDVTKDKDRSKNLMVFVLTEEDGEQSDEKISRIFLEL